MGTFCEIVKGSHVAFLTALGDIAGALQCLPHFLMKTKQHPLILPFFPTTFLAQSFSAPYFQLLGGSHIRCVVVACFAEAVSNWTVIQFPNPGFPHDITEKQKKDHDIIRLVTGKCPVWAFKS